jgi:hypothetical protein
MTNKQVPLPVHEKKKETITHSTDSTPVQPPPSFPDQQEFQPHLRELARGAIRLVLEAVMREELDALIAVAWGESSRQQQGRSQWLFCPQAGYDDGSH